MNSVTKGYSCCDNYFLLWILSDTLTEKKFAAITRRDGRGLNRVLASVFKAVSRNLPVKINCVLMRGSNDDEIENFIQLSKEVSLLLLNDFL